MDVKFNHQNELRFVLLVLCLSGPFFLGLVYTSHDSLGIEGNLPEGQTLYFKINNLAMGVQYNISVIPSTTIDFQFRVFSDRQCTEQVLFSDQSSVEIESSLFTPTNSGDYYLRLEASFGWGGFTLTVKEQLTGIQKTIELYSLPRLSWYWIVLPAIGGLVLLVILYFIIASIVKKRREQDKDGTKRRQRREAERKATRAFESGQEAMIEGFYRKALKHFDRALSFKKGWKQAEQARRSAQKAIQSLKEHGRLRQIYSSGDRERFINNFERASGLTKDQLESYGLQILQMLKDQGEIPDSQKMFLKMRIPLELQDDVRAYLLASITTEIDKLSPKIAKKVDEISQRIFKAYSSTDFFSIDFGDIVLEMNESIIDAKITLAAIQSAVKKPSTKIHSLGAFSPEELQELDKFTPQLFRLIQEQGTVSAFDVMKKLQIGCVTAHRLLSLFNYLKATDKVEVSRDYLNRGTKKLMTNLIEQDNGEMPSDFSIEELISKGLTALEAEAFLNEYERILKRISKSKFSEQESIQLQQDFFDLLEACKSEGLSASIASNIVLRNKSLEEAIRTDIHVRNAILPNLDSFTSESIELSSISLGAKKIEPRVFTEAKEEKPVIEAQAPIGSRGMVSGLLIDFEKDNVVACPYCGNIAKREMLAEWLKVKGLCPVCKNKLSIDECPELDVDEVYG
ncbi:MAG: hypothetical protein GF308_13340 [Candidatus Heimdallarchaeota archaeon]|nr:hypothetical protein [Candidatus Heimdallarchaeota archaeon]